MQRTSAAVQILLVCFVLWCPGRSAAKDRCSAKPVSAKQSVALLKALPKARGAKALGGKLEIFENSSGPDARADIFRYFTVRSTKSLPDTPVKNGLIGHFAVNRFTASVIDLSLLEPAKGDSAFSALQKKIRMQLCIGDDLVAKYRAEDMAEEDAEKF